MKNDKCRLQIPDTDIYLTPGCKVKLGRFEKEKWTLKYGWFSYGGNRPFIGWYLMSDTRQVAKPLQLTDLDDIYVIEQVNTGCNCDCCNDEDGAIITIEDATEEDYGVVRFATEDEISDQTLTTLLAVDVFAMKKYVSKFYKDNIVPYDVVNNFETYDRFNPPTNSMFSISAAKGVALSDGTTLRFSKGFGLCINNLQESEQADILVYLSTDTGTYFLNGGRNLDSYIWSWNLVSESVKFSFEDKRKLDELEYVGVINKSLENDVVIITHEDIKESGTIIRLPSNNRGVFYLNNTSDSNRLNVGTTTGGLLFVANSTIDYYKDYSSTFRWADIYYFAEEGIMQSFRLQFDGKIKDRTLECNSGAVFMTDKELDEILT